MIKLVPIESVHASEYNPRRNDEKRLALTELSLRKLGFLLPIYADRSGEILSGHQRHLVASRMGFAQIPVEYVSGKDLGERKAVNVLFNRATNDLQKQDTCDIIRRRLYEMDVESMVDGLPDIDPQSPAAFPCVNALARRDTVQLAKANHRSFDTHTRQLAKSLERRIGTAMPIVIGASENVINGIGRLQVAAEAKRPVVRCVVVTKEQEAFATAMLNLLSMDFDIASYADDLRYNSFMRERNTRETDAEGNAALGDGFFKGVFPKNRGRDFCKLEGAALEAWRRHYGSSVVDFGAGKLNNTRTLRKAGIHVAAFEPYFVTVGENIHKAELAKTQFQGALRLFPVPESGWRPKVYTCSAVAATGLEEVWKGVEEFLDHIQANGYFRHNRNRQNKYWMYESINEVLRNSFYHDPAVEARVAEYEKRVLEDKISSFIAAKELLDIYFKDLK